MTILRSRILDLLKVCSTPTGLPETRPRTADARQAQSRIFSTTFNPDAKRTGNKVLRQRLKGPSVAAYYPRRLVTFKDLKAAYPGLETWDDAEEDRLEKIEK